MDLFRADSVTQALQDDPADGCVQSLGALESESVYLLGLDAKNVWILFFAIVILLLVSILRTRRISEAGWQSRVSYSAMQWCILRCLQF